MRVGSLFAGIGGFDIAAERAGMEVVWQSEIDKHASRVLNHHWPHIKNLGDIHGITEPSAVDVLTGGFPCQDYSVAGNRGGLAGDRGALWWEYHRLIDLIRPTWVLGENVPGLLSSRGGADFEIIVRSLTELGYGVAWAVLDAQYFGVAQRRRRVFIVGHSGGQPRPEILALSEGMFGHPQPSRKPGQKVAPTIAARTSGGGWPGTDEATDGAVIAKTITAGQSMRYDSETETMIGPNGKGYADATTNPGYTLDIASGTQGVATQTVVRRLTPLECERLQGFPDGWTDIPGNSDSQRYRQLGNAVAVPVVEWILKRML